MSETSKATTGSNSEGNSMSPPEAEQTDTSDAENDGARKLPQSTGNQDEAERSVLDMDPSGISSETSRENGHGSQPRASHLRSSSSHVDEVTRVTSSLDGNETANNDGTSLNATRMNPKDESESDGNSVSSSQSQNQKSENEEAADNDSVTNLLREIQSVESTAASQKDPEGRYNSSRKFSDVDLKIDQREDEQKIMSPLEPPPVETLDAGMAESSEEEEKKTEGAPISPVTSLESTAVDALKQEPDTAAPESLLDQHEAAVQLELRTSPPINRIAPYAAESDLSVMSSQAPDPVATSGVIPTSYHQHMDPRIDPRNSLTMPALPQLLPAHQMVHGMPTHIAQGAPAPGPVGNGYHQALNIMAQMQHAPPPSSVLMPNSSIGGKRKIYLRLIEDITVPTTKERRSSFLSFRLKKVHQTAIAENEVHTDADRGRVTVSWYEGTTSLELQEHVRNTVSRKLGLSGTTKLSDMRVLDESSDPPEEIVLSTYIPDGSRLLLRFSTRDAGGDVTPMRRPSYTGGAPDSPSAAPSPHASALDLHGLGLNPNQLALLGARLDAVQMPLSDDSQSAKEKFYLKKRKSSQSEKKESRSKDSKSPTRSARKSADSKGSPDGKDKGDSDDENSKASSTMEMHSLHPEDHIQKSLRQITELLIAERTGKGKAVPYVPRQEKRQVIFVLANYFVLFLSLIAISAEIQARAPGWNASVEQYLKNVRSCSQDQDALFECVSNGDLAGLMASVVLWFSRSAATKRIFLFGFETPQKLWTVVYESLVTAICWGISYMFIRRGMNPDTRRNFLQKYWKDAIYGSLAGFNAAFMKHVLKNLIPQEAIEDALQERQLKILSWLPSFS